MIKTDTYVHMFYQVYSLHSLLIMSNFFERKEQLFDDITIEFNQWPMLKKHNGCRCIA